MQKHWYIAKAKPRNEKVLLACLRGWDVEPYYPMIRRPGSKSEAMEPLFPSYVFCRIDEESTQWPMFRWAPGLTTFLGTDGWPTVIPDELIERIQEGVDRWNNRMTLLSLSQGDHVTVTTGPFAGMDGVFQQYISSNQRCQILLAAVNRMVLVELPEHHLRSDVPAAALT